MAVTAEDLQKYTLREIRQRDPEGLVELIQSLSEKDAEALLFSWREWARPEQIVPEEMEPGLSWNVFLVLSGRGSGKSLYEFTVVPTPSGWTTMRDLQVGDQVFDEAGKPCTVMGKFHPPITQAYKITFSDGQELIADADHQWVTVTHRDRKQYLRYEHKVDFPENWPVWKGEILNSHYQKVGEYGPQIRNTEELKATLRQNTKRGDLNHCIPVARPLVLPQKEVFVDPWLLGYWLGNGTRKTSNICAGSYQGDFDKDFVITQVKRAGYECSYQHRPERGHTLVSVKKLVGALRRYDLLDNKHIPAIYFRGSIEQRISLLRGLMDSDGYIGEGVDGKKSNHAEFCSTTKQLAEDVQELVHTLGERTTLHEGRATLDGRDYGPKYRVTWRPSLFNPFSLPRKADVCTPPDSQGLRLRHRMITSIEPVAPRPMLCITVDSPNSMYLVGKGLIPTHNTKLATEYVREQITKGAVRRVALVGRTAADTRDVLINGEALALDTVVPIPSGWTTMGELEVGDEVFDKDGEIVRVVALRNFPNRPVYDMEIKGEIICADENHLWLTANNKERRRKGNWTENCSVKRTKEISDTLYNPYQRNNLPLSKNHLIPRNAPIKLKSKRLSIPPYTLGAWLGDGSTGGDGTFSCADREIIGFIEEDGFSVTKRAAKYEWGILGLCKKLRMRELQHHKHIPKEYLRASIPQRLRLLQGLCDTDGTVAKNGQCSFDNNDEKLVKQARELCVSLGFKCSAIEKRKPHAKFPDAKCMYRFSFFANKNTVCPFRLPRKAQRCQKPVFPTGDYIQNAKFEGFRDVKCIQTSSPSNTFLVGENFIVTHNSGICNIFPNSERPKWMPSQRKVTFPNSKAICTAYSSERPDQLRGPEHDLVIFDELAAFKNREETFNNAMLGLRLGPNPRALITTTPRPVNVLRKLLKREGKDVIVRRGSTYDNKDNLSQTFLDQIKDEYEGTSFERQEIYGELFDQVPGALWTRDMIDRNRLSPRERHRLNSTFEKIVVGVDPAVGKDGQAGIVVAARDDKRQGYILADRTKRGRPDEWAAEAVKAYHLYEANYIVAEVNQGGEMVKLTIQTIDPNVPVKTVHASKGKIPRAQPVAARYEKNEVKHIGSFSELEDEMCNFTGEPGEDSPNRLDACFVAGTKILTRHDPEKPIENIEVGDEVLTRQGWKRVVNCGMTDHKPVMRVEFDNGEFLEGTENHPIWTEVEGWLRLDALVCGQKCAGSLRVSAVHHYENKIEPVYNLEVEDQPEYFANGVLVHNCVWALTDLLVKGKKVNWRIY